MREALRWKLHGWADWLQARGHWSAAGLLDRMALAIYRTER